MYRLVQEALRRRTSSHAAASEVGIVVTRRDGGVSAVIEDDGQGFAESDVRDDALGLLGMRERLALLGGTLAIESTPGEGTAVIAYLPLAVTAEEPPAG